jgi:hypothetical protein
LWARKIRIGYQTVRAEARHKLVLKNPELNAQKEVSVKIVAGEVTVVSVDMGGGRRGRGSAGNLPVDECNP